MDTRHTEGMWIHEVCIPPKWVSESLPEWICVQQDIFPGAGGPVEGGCSAFSVANPMQTVVAVTSKRHSGGDDLPQWAVMVKKGGQCTTLRRKICKLRLYPVFLKKCTAVDHF